MKNIKEIKKTAQRGSKPPNIASVTDFVSVGGLGFDQIAASLIIEKKQQGSDVRLVFALPCRNQDEK